MFKSVASVDLLFVVDASFTMEPSHYAAVKEELADIRQAS